jgi:hypothetical protein
MYQNPQSAPKTIINIKGLINAVRFIKSCGNMNLAIVAPRANSNNVAMTQNPP